MVTNNSDAMKKSSVNKEGIAHIEQIDGRTLDTPDAVVIAPFLSKLYQLVSAISTDSCVTWTEDGDSFVITNQEHFSRNVLPVYFKHSNIRSFIRQLNTYGFRKRANISSNDDCVEFYHPKFRKGQPGMLMKIKRCHQPKAQARANKAAVAVPEESADIRVIENNVGELKSTLGDLHNEIMQHNLQMEQKVSLLLHLLHEK